MIFMVNGASYAGIRIYWIDRHPQRWRMGTWGQDSPHTTGA